MSDHSEEIQDYETKSWEELAVEFIEKYNKEWYEFVSEKYFKGGK